MAPFGAVRTRLARAVLRGPAYAAMRNRHLWAEAVRRAKAVLAGPPSAATEADRDVLAEAYGYTKDPGYLAAALERWGSGPSDAAGVFRGAYLARAAARDRSVARERARALTGQMAACGIPAGGDPVAAACARLALAGYLGVGRRGAAEEDLVAALEEALDGEGAHRSGSPGTHVAVHGMLAAVLESGLTRHRALVRLRNRMEDVLAWMVAPDGTLAEAGETRPAVIARAWNGDARPSRMANLYRNPALLHAATMGRVGTAPVRGWRVIPGAGIAVVKRGWPNPAEGRSGSDHLVFLAPNPARAHDDALSLTWFWGGRWILIEGGQLAEDTGPPRSEPDAGIGRRMIRLPAARALAEYYPSARAHNTVVLAGHSAAEGEFTGSGEIRGTPVIDARRSGEGLEHHRSVAVGTDWLLVLDRVAVPPDVASECRFLSPAGLDVMVLDRAFLLAEQGRPITWVRHLTPEPDPIDPVRGVAGETATGWRTGATGRPAPAWAYGWAHRGSFQAATVFAGSGPVTATDAGPDRYAWEAGGRRVSVRVDGTGITDIEERTAA